MFLRNFDVWRSQSVHEYKSAGVFTNDSNLTYKYYSGATISPSSISGLPLRNPSSSGSTSGYTIMVLGTGNTPVSYDDYRLKNYASVRNTSTARTPAVYNSINDTYESTITAVYNNQNDFEVVISEFGLILTTRSGVFAIEDSFLFYREVLDAPITLRPGEGTTISMTYSTDGHPNKPDTYYKVNETLTNCSASWNVGSTSSGEYRDTFTATSGYTLPASITVTMGGIAVPPVRYSYDSSTGAFSMTGITDDVVITVAAETAE